VTASADAEVGRVAGLLALGAVLQLLATLAVTDVCRSMEEAAGRDAAAHNAIVDARTAATRADHTGRAPKAVAAPVGGGT
jgi:hypothetical protein